MSITAKFVEYPPDVAAFEDLMHAYYTVIVDNLRKFGDQPFDKDEMVQSTMAKLGEMLPPSGRLLLAHNAQGQLIGCGGLRKIQTHAAEMKRMFVRPEAQGLGLGRTLFEMRIEEAKAMGLKTLYADTYKGNRSMLSMYEKFGFEYIERYEGNANTPDLDPILVYLKRDL